MARTSVRVPGRLITELSSLKAPSMRGKLNVAQKTSDKLETVFRGPAACTPCKTEPTGFHHTVPNRHWIYRTFCIAVALSTAGVVYSLQATTLPISDSAWIAGYCWVAW